MSVIDKQPILEKSFFHFGILLLGIIVVPLIATVCFFVTLGAAFFYSDGSGNAVFLADRGLYPQIVAAFTSFMFSVVFFYFRTPKKIWAIFHTLVFISIATFFGVQFGKLRTEQQEILAQYQEFRKAVLDQEYDQALNTMTFTYIEKNSIDDLKRDVAMYKSLEAFEEVDSIYTVHFLDKNKAFIVTDQRASRWYRSSYGVGLEFEKIESQWRFAGTINFYMAD